MAKMIIHRYLLGQIKIDGEVIDDKIKELELDPGTYDIVAGKEVDRTRNTVSDKYGARYSTIWGLHNKVKVDETSVCHVYVKQKFSLIRTIPTIKVKYK